MATLKNTIFGKGWKFPVQFDARGSVAMQGSDSDNDARELVRQHLVIAIGTAVNSVPMVRAFGSQLPQALYKVIQPNALTGLLLSNIRDAVARWVPEVEDFRVSFDSSEEDRNQGRVGLNAKYRLIGTQVEDNIVIPYVIQDNGHFDTSFVHALTL